jgi:O-antigen/teichoic acid export membrane protein
MLKYFSSSEEVAFYGSANKLKSAALVFLPIFQSAIQPALARTWHESKDRFAELVSHATRILVAIALPIVVAMILIPDFLAQIIFGPQFWQSALAIACVAPILILSSLNVLMGSSLNVISNGVSFLIVTAISVFMNAGLNALAISYAIDKFGPGAGAAAAAIATVISEIFVLLAMRRIFRVGLDQKRMWKVFGLAAFPVVLLGANFQGLQAISPFVRIGAAALILPIYMFAVKLVRFEDLRWLMTHRQT